MDNKGGHVAPPARNGGTILRWMQAPPRTPQEVLAVVAHSCCSSQLKDAEREEEEIGEKKERRKKCCAGLHVGLIWRPWWRKPGDMASMVAKLLSKPVLG